MLLVLSVFTGGIIGLLFEKLLMVMLKPVLPSALPPASFWPWLWAIGAMVVISVLVGLRPYRLLLATQPLRVLRNDVVANVWPLKFYLPVIIAVAVGLLAADGRQHAAVGGAGRCGCAGAAVRRTGLDTAQRSEEADGEIAARAHGR